MLFVSLHSQTINENLIKKSGDYFWGEGVSNNQSEAEDMALSRMINKIAVNVASTFESQVSESSEGIEDKANKILRTYSTATLKNLNDPIILKESNTFKVIQFIKKNEVAKIFAERTKLVQNLFSKGIEFNELGFYGDALKNFYFSLLLMNSIPQQNFQFDGVNLKTEIPSNIKTILDGVRIKVTKDIPISDKIRRLDLSVRINDNDVNNLDFSFWNGNNQINAKVVDGQCTIKLIGESTKFSKLDVYINYNYYESRDHIKEVKELWDLVLKPTFINYKQIELDTYHKVIETQELLEAVSKSSFFDISLSAEDTCSAINSITKNTLEFLEVLNDDNYSNNKIYLGYDNYLKQNIARLKKYNGIEVIDKDIAANVNKTYDGWELRKINVLNSYKSLRRQSNEYLVLDFDRYGELEGISFGIMENLYEQIKKQSEYGNDWNERHIMIKFLEKYRTAFLNRDMEIIDNIFADEALIIVGRLKQKGKMKDGYNYLKLSDEQPDYEKIKLTKGEYLNRLGKLFNSVQDIFLDFSSFEIVRKNNQRGIYGLNLRQHYNSTIYSDEGYLFLLVDFNANQPQIYVRAWQPQEWDKNTLVKLSNYRIN